MTSLLVAIISSICFVQMIRWIQHANGSIVFAAWVNYQFAGSFFLVPLFLREQPIDWPVVAIGLVTGFLYVTNFYLLSAMIRLIGVGLVAATAALAVILPVGVSIALGDPWVDKAAGLCVVIIALPIIALARTDLGAIQLTVSPLTRLAAVLILFFAIGAENTCIKIARELGGTGFESSFLPGLFGTAAFVATPALIVMRPKLQAVDVWRGFILGACNVVSNFAMALAVQQLTGPVVFPVKLIGVLVGTSLLGRFLWREHLSRLGHIGIGLSILGVLLLTMTEAIGALI